MYYVNLPTSLRIAALVCGALTILFLAPASARAATPAAIRFVFTSDHQLHILGQNLPSDSRLQVYLGDAELKIVRAAETQIIAELPELPPDDNYALTLVSGVTSLVLDKPTVAWGLLVSGKHP